MFKRLFLITMLGVMLSGCFVAPLALIGPATSGFTTASIAQSGASTTANYIFKQKTGKSFVEHALFSINKKKSEAILRSIQQTYLPKKIVSETKVTHK